MKPTKLLGKMLLLVRKGEIDFTEFVRETRSEFNKMAGYLLKRWRAPAWYTLDDVAQELYFGAWHYVWHWNEAGASIARFVVFNAMNMAKRALHVARGVTISGSPDRKLSNFEQPFSDLTDDQDFQEFVDGIVADGTSADEQLQLEQERKEAIASTLKSCETKEQRYVTLAVRETGSIDLAGQLLYDEFRIPLRLQNEEAAEMFVARHGWSLVCKLLPVEAAAV